MARRNTDVGVLVAGCQELLVFGCSLVGSLKGLRYA